MENKKIKIAISGAIGRMGKQLIKQVQKKKNFSLSVLLIKNKNEKNKEKIKKLTKKKIQISDSIKSIKKDFDILIDFSSPKNTIKNINYCIKHKKKIVIGTTGFNKKEEKKIKKAKKQISILKSTNFSIGINTILNVLKKITKKIGQLSDIDIIEKHHKKKIDSPSGTAITISKQIQKKIGKKKKITFSTIRAGKIIGDHKIIFTMPEEIVTITHQAINRKIFTTGAIIAAKWLYKKKPGLYNMQNVLKDI